jgi:dTDP-4-amino-4,6-dideoxygalactose transaminase
VKNSVPFNKPFLDERLIGYLRQAVSSGSIGGDGPICKEVEGTLRSQFGLRHVLLTTSCTHALETAMMILDLRPGDEVVLPSFTFVSTANAVLRAGGKPVFCEVLESTLTMDPEDLARRLTPRTRAVIPVHYAGVGADMDPIMEIARERRLAVVEDAAQGVNATYRGRYLGSIGDAAAYSFHHTKNYVSGEGGAFVTNDDALARRAEIVREKGTNRANFLRGEVDKYTWVDEGSSFVLSDLLAAVLKYQLELLGDIQVRRREIHERYLSGLKDLASSGRLTLPVIPGDRQSNYHIFLIVLPSEAQRNALMQKLKEAGVGATFHYIPLHSSPYAREHLGTGNLQLPVTDRMAGCLLRLPIYPELSDEAVDRIVGHIHDMLR